MIKKHKKGGFTLIELIIVLVILAILIALLIPSLTGYIKKANEKKALVECRMTVEAAQTILSEKYGTDSFASIELDPSLINADVLKLAEVNGELLGDIQFDEHAKITYLEYVYHKKTIAVYDITHDPNYYISEESSALYGYINDASKISKELVGEQKYDRLDLIAEMAKKYGGFQVASYFTDKTTSYKGKTLYWRPYYLKDEDGNFSVYLYANTDSNPESHGLWEANLIYVNGSLYEVPNGNIGIAESYNYANSSDFQTALKANGSVRECE